MPDQLTIIISLASLVISVASVLYARATHRRDRADIELRASMVTSPEGNHIAFIVANSGRRPLQAKGLILQAPGYSPMLDYFYYADPEEVTNRMLKEAEDFFVTIPYTVLAEEAVMRAKKIYLIDSLGKKYYLRKGRLKILKAQAAQTEVTATEGKLILSKKESRIMRTLIFGYWRAPDFPDFVPHSESRSEKQNKTA